MTFIKWPKKKKKTETDFSKFNLQNKDMYTGSEHYESE